MEDLERKILEYEKSLIAMRKEFIAQRRDEAFLSMAKISSTTLGHFLKKDKFLSAFLYDSVQDGSSVAYYVDVNLGKGRHFHQWFHTDLLLERPCPTETLTSETFWIEFFSGFVLPQKENKTAAGIDILEKVTQKKELRESDWLQIKTTLKDEVMTSIPLRTSFLSGLFFARFAFMLVQCVEEEEQFPGRLYPCPCITHFISNESQWLFPCIGVVPFA